MAKKPVVPETEVSVHSLTDVGYQQGKANSTNETLARFAMSRIPTLGDPNLDRSEQIDKESREELKKGYMTYYHEKIEPTKFFAIVDGNVVEKPEAEWNEMTGYERRQLNVHIAFGMTQAALNDLKETMPVYYGLVQSLKTDFNTYTSNRLGDLIKKAKELRAKALGLKRERAPTKVFTTFEKETLDGILTRCRTAQERGIDPTADVERTKRKIAAYNATE